MQQSETVSKAKADAAAPTISMVAAGPQYGVAIIPAGAITPAAATVSDDIEAKDLHIPNKTTERFKVVKIASAEPFRRGRWKCMDYADHAPPVTTQHSKSTAQAPTAVQIGGNMYLQTQSLPPQQIQQLLMQSGFTTGTPQFGGQSQAMPQAQYFYQNPQLSGNPQFVATNSQQFFQPGVVTTAAALHNFQNLQLLQQAYQNQTGGSAFVPTTQSFQPGQTYAGQTTYSEAPTQAPVLNGYTYPTINEQQVAMPTQVAKNVILSNATEQAPAVEHPVAEQYQVPQNVAVNQVPTDPQVIAAIQAIPVAEIARAVDETVEGGAENPEDPTKSNPVVNAIDNKIEQAMDLVKSHLMYTVREEVEILKEKIAELMERIQQLETENAFLRSQIPKNPGDQGSGGGTSDSTPQQ